MGAGKSTYAKQLAQSTEGILISEDEWLSTLYPEEIHSFDDFLVRHRRLLKTLLPHVEVILRSGLSVILDFPANTAGARKQFLEIARNANAQHRAVYLNVSNERCLEQIAKRRVEQPERAKFDTPEVFKSVIQYFEVPDESEGLNLEIVQP
jgi:predicted kinase